QQLDVIDADHGGNESDLGAEFLEYDRSIERLCDYDRNFTAREELRFLAGVRQQMRLGEDFRHVMIFEKLEKRVVRNVGISRRDAIGHVLRQQQRYQRARGG